MSQTNPRRNYFPNPDPDNPPTVRPIWGYVAQMLREGRDWKGKDGYTPIGFSPKHPLEPDPAISNKCTTNTLIGYMMRANWSVTQVREALLDPENVGGAYFRFRVAKDPENAEDYLLRTFKGSVTQGEVQDWKSKQREKFLESGVDPKYVPDWLSRGPSDPQPQLSNTYGGGTYWTVGICQRVLLGIGSKRGQHGGSPTS